MRKAYTVEQVRAAEAAAMARLPEGALMMRAAHGLAVAIARLLGRVYGARVLLLVGSGDNGGDALYAGAMLARRGARVEALLLSERVHTEGLAALIGAGGRVATGKRPDVVVDGIVGIGGRGSLRPEAAAVVAALGDAPVVAVDLPSGVFVDDGSLAGPHVRADLTVTFGCHKVAHLADPAAASCGRVELVDLGLELPEPYVEALDATDVARFIGVDPSAHKYSRGVVGLATGSQDFPGAAVLGAAGALAGLAGMVRHVGAASDAVVAAHPEVVPGRGRVQAWVVGSGGGAEAEAALTLAREDDVPVVVDADALAHLRPEDGSRQLVLTPHAGELARMLGIPREEVEAEPFDWATGAAAKFNSIVLLKGRRTVIAHPEGPTRVNTTGTPWLATAGSGDVLAGLIGSLLAAGLTPYDAASVGAWLHGAAAERIGGPLRAGQLPGAVAQVLSGLVSAP